MSVIVIFLSLCVCLLSVASIRTDASRVLLLEGLDPEDFHDTNGVCMHLWEGRLMSRSLLCVYFFLFI